MAFLVKPWNNGPAGGTRINGPALRDLEERLSGYTDDEVAAAVGGLGPAPRDPTPQIVTANLADAAEEVGAIALPRTTRFLRVAADRACRIRVYGTAADRDRAAEVAREPGSADDDNSGLIAEWNLPTPGPTPENPDWVASLVIRCNPQPVGSNFDGPVADQLYWRIQNKSGAASPVTVDLTTQRVE